MDEARAVCNFDWHQPLAARIAAAQRHATPAYGAVLARTAASGQWTLTQCDRERGTCTHGQTREVVEAPNTATVRYVRVAMTQAVQADNGPPHDQTFSAMYRVVKQADGTWLVASEGGGG